MDLAMVLKKRYSSYHWRLFVPIVVMMWSIIVLLMWFQHHREMEYRETSIKKQLAFFNSRILYAHANNVDLKEFMESLKHFFSDSRFEDVRVSVYMKDDFEKGAPPRYYMGKPIGLDFITAQSREDEDDGHIHTDTRFDNQSMFFYKACRSNDGEIYVFTAMPLTVSLSDALNTADVSFWIVLSLLLIGSTVITYWTTTTLTRNITMLKKFALDANNPNVRFDESKFPHNELGDISREIVRLYRERSDALERSKREHNIAIHAIEEKSRIKRQLTNNINHEIKTPVGVIKGYLDTVLSSDDMDEKTRDYFLKRAQQNVDRLCSLLNDVSTITRLEEGSSNIPLQAVDLHSIVFSIDNDFETSGMNGNMTFKYDIPLDCEVLGNTNLLTSTITNLIKNAVIHSRGTVMELRLVAESEKYYTFSFSDNGSGVEDSHLPHLFDRFYRVDSGRSRKSGGTGLGLPIVKSIIETMGGSISVHNRSVGGLEFMFTLKKAI